MYVIATAGHVDHGKSALLRALTGMEPDRWAEERRRGLTIDLGFAWTAVGGADIAFVDVPGHERFAPNMLAGVGAVPAVLFVVAADEGWQPQATEHLAALDAFGVRHGLLAVTKSDRADPAGATEAALERLRARGLGEVPAVAVSATTGAGLPELRECLLDLVSGLPAADDDADVRLWVDRSFSVRGAGTVVTGTLGAGVVRVGDALELAGSGRRVVVRGLHTLGRPAEVVRGTARVAVNLRGAERDDLRRGDALLTPTAWRTTTEVDVALRGRAAVVNRELVLHIGSAAAPCRVRPLGTSNARLRTQVALPLRAGDVGLLRDPGGHRIVCGVEVLDPDPPTLAGRGAAGRRERELRDGPVSAYLRRHGAVGTSALRALGWPSTGVEVDGWCVDPDLFAALPGALASRVAALRAADPLAPGVPVALLRQETAVPDTVLRDALTAAGLAVSGGLVRAGGDGLPDALAAVVAVLEERWAAAPFAAPEADDLAALGLGQKELAAAERAGRLVRLSPSVVLPADAPATAASLLAALPAPFTVSAARSALGATRRVAVPLLEHLDRRGVTVRDAAGQRRLRGAG
ncbi:selenocysteine-specific translation elongation factor [Actinokineospora guangxiensis]|uniref:Selenocysteine-specific elongation factor n=1 Tax=Actinokineospora guangxiensis TaxID=1490288 RepID=A0ABW0ES44_9PSEU